MSMTAEHQMMKSAEHPDHFHWTVDTFYRAIAGGVFDEPNRWELVNGELWDRTPMNPPHAAATRRIFRRLRTLFEPAYLVMMELPFHIAEDGEPHPDVCVLVGTEADYESAHPRSEDIRLIIEVADTTVVRDSSEIALLYAQAGIADYWVSLINERKVIIFRNPAESGYSASMTLTESDTIAPLFARDILLSVPELLPAVPLPI